MPRYKRHIFVCINRRAVADPRGCCSDKGADEVRSRFKSGLKARALTGIVRANAAGCLDSCERGVTVVVYPEAVWYGGVTPRDVDEIIEKHIIDGEVVKRLLLKEYADAPRNLPRLTTDDLRTRPGFDPYRQK
jgi:(2Fe-2S) ferredoxin